MKLGLFRSWVYVLFLLSGCAALIYEVLWTRQLTLVLGGTTYAITTVVVSFMTGLGLGSYIGGRFSSRLAQPGRVYAILEIAIGLYALLIPTLMGSAEPLYRVLYPRTVDYPWLLMAARFCVSAIILIVPTTLMGATLPLLISHVIRGGRSLGRSTGWLYGINTCGATLGALLAGFLLIPWLGLTRTTWLTAGVNLAIGVLGWFVLGGPRVLPSTVSTERKKRPDVALVAELLPAGAVLIVACISGLAAMIYQIAWTRALIMSLGSSTYSFTCILSAFIMGLGLGSLLVAWTVDRFRRPVVMLALMEIGIGLSALLILPIHGQIPRVVALLVAQHHDRYATLLALEFTLIVAVTLIPTLLMGAAFPLMARIVGSSLKDPARAVGRLYTINTMGSIVGALLGGFVLIRGEVLGIQYSIVVAALANILAGAFLLIRAMPATWSRPRVAVGSCAVVLPIALIILVFGKWDTGLLVSGPFKVQAATPASSRQVIFFREDVETTVAVTQERGVEDSLSLTVNGKVDASASSLDARTQLMLGHLPALLGSNAKQACIIGLGSGMTLAAVARYPSYQQLDCIEISNAVINAAAYFAPYCNDVLTADPRVRLIRADGRNHLLLNERQYDLIVSEPSNPWIAGISSLFTREFFQTCRRRLTPNGQLAVWIHSYSLSVRDFKMVVRTLTSVFETVSLWELTKGDYCLVAGNRPGKVAVSGVLQRYLQPAVRADLYRAGIHDLAGVLGAYVVGGQRLRDWAATARVNTDDNSRLEFSAPRAYYRDESWTITREVNQLQESPFEQLLSRDLDAPAAGRLTERVAAVSDARQSLWRGSIQWQEGARVQAMQTMLDGYRRDPGNVLLAFMGIEEIRRIVQKNGIPVAEKESARQWTEQIDRLPKPLYISSRSDSLPKVISELERSAFKDYQSGDASSAAMFLTRAHELAPDNNRIVGTLGLALIRDKQLDQADAVLSEFLERFPTDGWANYAASHLALARNQKDMCLTRLAAVLKSGAFTVEQVKNDPNFAPLRDDERFVAMFGAAPASQPMAR